eukprot:CAMPEP_0194376106 /NCGR_PEP_ID=MMETSP0174-20130528/24602_1 /TAXON_ID=216777 /ORGANISM="Proboscia alata, Strain PI-D3" /LENGTH=463 /DNA_ID=CAMNT_0039156663 /DNA_START=116 /DNA_END=1507 /DNA_ORIENTATION=-
MPKAPSKSATNRHAPLGQVLQDAEHRSKYVVSKRASNTASNSNDSDEEELLDERTSSRILKLSRAQLEEEERHTASNAAATASKSTSTVVTPTKAQKEVVESDDEFDDDVEEEEEEEEIEISTDGGYVTMNKLAPGLTAEEEAMVSSMMGNDSTERKTLADIIMDKIHETEQQQESTEEPKEAPDPFALPEKVVQVYTDIGVHLSRYTSGKLPKAFKIIPSLSNWEQILYLTRPDRWTPMAMYAATRIFASNLNPKMATQFYKLVLLDAIRADIYSEHQLNYHYYMALKKSLYKPSAFFKGILLPLTREDCTLREAAIVGSVLAKVSIPVQHAAVAIHKLCQQGYTAATSIFIKTLLNKKYSLPSPVIGSLIDHFGKFANNPKEILPVLWHQCFLVFVQRYKNEIGEEGKELLKRVLKVHSHHKITPEIRRELFGAAAWKEERGSAATGSGASVMTGVSAMEM